jgi:predicted aldo/keto reductase-like oxidoreductase
MQRSASLEPCRLCNECVAKCGQQIPISAILRCERYARIRGNLSQARRMYASLETRADSCTFCGACMDSCPQAVPIPEKLAAVHRLLA